MMKEVEVGVEVGEEEDYSVIVHYNRNDFAVDVAADLVLLLFENVVEVDGKETKDADSMDSMDSMDSK